MLATRLMGATSAAAAANIEYVGGRTFSFAGTTSNVTISLLGTLTGGLATSPSNDDIIIVYFGTGSNADRNLVVSGYTEVAELYSLGTTYDTNLVVAYRVYSFGAGTITLTGGSLATADAGTVAVQVWRGVDTTTPLDVTSTTATGAGSVLCNPPAITPTTSGAIIVSGGAGAHNNGPGVYSSSDLTEFLTVVSNDTFDATIGLGYYVWTSGSFDPAQFTFSSGNNSAYSWAAVTLALRPA